MRKIRSSVVIGDNPKISDFVVIESNCRIGDNIFIGYGCVLRPKTVIGNNCVIGHYCVFEGNLTIGNGVHIMPQCHLTSYMTIEDDVFIAPCVSTGNDKKMAFKRGDYVPKGPTIRRGARIGLSSILLPEIEIGENALVAAGTLVVKDVPAGKIAMGRPAEIVGDVPKEEWI